MKKLETILLPLIAMILLESCQSLKTTYLKEVEMEKVSNSMDKSIVITEEDVVHLPYPVKKYFQYCGFIGKELPFNCTITWEDVEFKMSAEKNWMPIKCLQFNSVKEPARFAYLYAPKLGINMFVGRDKYQHGAGNMHIRILGLFNLQNERGKAMDESSLVTILSETLFVPGYALQPYIKWEPIDSLSARATITHNGISVSGFFYFNPKGELTHFVSYDRNSIGSDGVPIKVPWVASVDCYNYSDNGLIFPAYVRATWKYPQGDLEYFKGKVARIEYNK